MTLVRVLLILFSICNTHSVLKKSASFSGLLLKIANFVVFFFSGSGKKKKIVLWCNASILYQWRISHSSFYDYLILSKKIGNLMFISFKEIKFLTEYVTDKTIFAFGNVISALIKHEGPVILQPLVLDVHGLPQQCFTWAVVFSTRREQTKSLN